MAIPKWLRSLAFILLVIAPLTPGLIDAQWQRDHPVIMRFLDSSYLLWVLLVLYDRWNLFYFYTTKALLWLGNAEVRWSMRAEWQGLQQDNPIEVFTEALSKSYKDLVLWQDDSTEKIVKLPIGCMVRLRQVAVFDGLEDQEEKVILEIADLIVPFRRSTKMLEDIVGILSMTHASLIPREEKYNFRVIMPSSNPYFGLFVRQLRLPQQQLTSFICEFTERVGPQEENIQVNDERISLVAHSLSSLQILSRRYITLATLDLTSSA